MYYRSWSGVFSDWMGIGVAEDEVPRMVLCEILVEELRESK